MSTRVGLFGTFDVQNYGDLLFPHIVRWRLARADIAVDLYSPTGNMIAGQDVLPSAPAASAFETPGELKAVIVGGGNIIHNRQVRLRDYVEAGVAGSAYLSLWMLPAIAAAANDIPIVWNAPGVPAQFTPDETKSFLRHMLIGLSYASVRDEASAKHLGAPKDALTIVPDTALEIAAMWPKEGLLPDFRLALERAGVQDHEGGILALHVKERSVAATSDEDLGSFAQGLMAVCQARGLRPVLLSLAPCHDDDVFARRLSTAIGPSAALVEGLNLREIAAVIAHARAYAGSSLHGFITASSYGTPATLVAVPELPKFRGFAELTGQLDAVVADWTSAFEALLTRVPTAPDLTAVQRRLDDHWAGVLEGINSGSRDRPGRSAMLRHLIARQLSLEGSDWALTPYTHKSGRH